MTDNNAPPPPDKKPEKKQGELAYMIKLLTICFVITGILFGIVALFPQQTKGLQNAMQAMKEYKPRIR